ncbi:isoprenoid synthase domain-containing protein [Chaetomidium leptoderma]|uniref:Isoprenoid synthase domain-containing protein n=1 Tax=Chaetomidium leptoderma TaxID=669021 RepID=A0AAN7A004_9PEZI|nr:isoprenoid synthase domain-containing protein [Chaetomidium leptoderma]
MEPANGPSNLSANTLSGQRLYIPNLQPAFASWKQGVNPLHPQVRHVVDTRLEGLFGDERVLAKVKAADIGLFASGWFPDAPYEVLETVAFYSVWLVLWDDAIDGAGASEGGLAAEEYCQQSVAFVRCHLGLDGPGTVEPKAPTKVCESFAEVGRRVGERCGLEQRMELFEHLREYMEACVTEYRWRLSEKVPSVDEFYSWRLKTSAVDVMLDLCRILNGIALPGDILQSKELAAMGLDVNKLLILINELFSLKKELNDGAFGNLIPITMRALNLNLEGATQSVMEDIYSSVQDFDNNASTLQRKVASEEAPGIADQLGQLIEAYQAIATTVLHFSIQSPRYGLLKDRQEDGSVQLTMASSNFTYPSPLTGYENAAPLPDERAEDGKSFRNPQTGVLSSAYEKFTEPLDNGRRGGFDVHIYYFQTNPEQSQHARHLWERIRREFPELRIYTLFNRPIGPHPVAMFEVNLFTPAQFGAFIPWLAVWRGPLSVLVHPNTTETDVSEAERDLRNHTQQAIWMGERLPLDVARFR